MSWNIFKRKNQMPAPDSPDWERALINRVAAEFLREQRRSRRWANVFKLGIAVYLIALVAIYVTDSLDQQLTSVQEHAAVIEIQGVIAPEAKASAERVNKALRKAFAADHAKAVILDINSPGGSPVQAGLIYNEIKRLREKHPDKKLYAVAADTCASAAYYIASAADEIHVDSASLVGSIGVRLDSFGLERTIEELGIQRRLLTAGEHKAILDPFSEFNQWDRDFLQALLDDLHQQFIDAVKAGRGDRLEDNPELFSGLFWTGDRSLTLGLSDGLGSVDTVARDLVGVETTVDYTQKRDLLERFAENFGAGAASALIKLGGLDGLPRLH